MPAYVSLAQHERFSQSRIWQIQRQYFQERGIGAWQDGEVPHYVTSNPTIAAAYAEVVCAFMKDRLMLQADSGERIYILELGCGSGRFAFHFLKHLHALYADAIAALPAFTYILSDLSDKNIAYLRQHPKLQHYIQKGTLDFAHFDAEQSDTLELLESGRQIVRSSLRAPLVVIANYFFDSIPQDLFYIDEKYRLYDGRLSLYTDAEWESLSPKALMDSLETEFSILPVKEPYIQPAFNELIKDYQQALPDSWLLFPHMGIACLDKLRALSQEGFLLLSADKGRHKIDELQKPEPPYIARHGSFSIPVNYHAIETYYTHEGAEARSLPYPSQHLNISCILLCPHSSAYKACFSAYQRYISTYGPDDFFSIKKHLEQHIGSMELRHIIAYLRMTHYDGRFFEQFYPRLRDILPQTGSTEAAELVALVTHVWETYFPIGEQEDMAFNLGMLLYQLDHYREAITFFEASLDYYEPIAPLYYNMAACYYQLYEDEKVAEYIEKTFALDPGHEAAGILLHDISQPITE